MDNNSRWKPNLAIVVTAVISATGSAWSVNESYFTLVRRVDAVEQANAEQTRSIATLRESMRQQGESNDAKLRDISNDVKDIRNWLMNNAGSQRAELRQWRR